MSSTLKQQTISGMLWSAIQRFGTMIISFVSNIVLARLLSPDDYGCIGLLTIFIVLADTFVQGGFGAALIQKKEPTKEDYSTVFYWNIIVSILMYVLLFFVAPYVAQFYKIPLLSSVLRVQGIILLTNALSIVQLNILRKELKFKKLSIIQLLSAFFSVIVAIILAYQGFGVWTLVFQQLSMAFTTTLLLWVTTSWKPNFSFSKQSFKELFGYGSFLLLSDLLNNLSDNVQGLIIGRKFSVGDMGFYTQAYKLETIPTTSISQVVNLVAFPVYSKLQDDKEKLFLAVRKTSRMMNFLNFPLMILLILVANELIVFLYSDKWLESIPYFQILCVSGLVNCIQSINYQVVCAVGRSKLIFRWNIVKRLVGLASILVGMNFGVKGILWGMVFGFYFTALVNILVASPITNYDLYKQLKDIIPILCCAVVVALVVHSIMQLFDTHYILTMFIKVILYVVLYVLVAKIFKSQELEEYFNILKSYLKR
jgi:O-antigen/teichoic acid export membrane protein